MNGLLCGSSDSSLLAICLRYVPCRGSTDFPLLLWCFGKFDHAILVWLVLFVFSFLAPILQMAIVNKYLPTRYTTPFFAAMTATCTPV